MARAWGETTARSEAEPGAAALYEATSQGDRKIVEAVTAVATERGVSRAQIALAWLHRNPIVAAPIVGALKPAHIDDAVAAVSVTLSDDEVERLELPYTPRLDTQAVSEPAMLARAVEATTGFRTSAA